MTTDNSQQTTDFVHIIKTAFLVFQGRCFYYEVKLFSFFTGSISIYKYDQETDEW